MTIAHDGQIYFIIFPTIIIDYISLIVKYKKLEPNSISTLVP
jgi:hypothetical protein